MANHNTLLKGSVSSSGNASGSTGDYFSSDFFEPDVMLPSQFDLGSDKGVGEGVRRLMAALLADGIEAYVLKQSSLRAPLNSETKEWIETKDYSYVFSFDNVCESLGINADYLRLGLSRYISHVRSQRSKGIEPTRVWKKIRRPRKK